MFVKYFIGHKTIFIKKSTSFMTDSLNIIIVIFKDNSVMITPYTSKNEEGTVLKGFYLVYHSRIQDSIEE